MLIAGLDVRKCDPSIVGNPLIDLALSAMWGVENGWMLNSVERIPPPRPLMSLNCYY